MHCHCATNNRAPRMGIHGGDSCKPEVRPGTREESASPAWLAAPVTRPKMTEKTNRQKIPMDNARHQKLRLQHDCGPT